MDDPNYELAYLLGRRDAYMDRPLPPLQGQPDPPPIKDSLSCSSPASPRRAGPAAETPREGGGTAGGAPENSPGFVSITEALTGEKPDHGEPPGQKCCFTMTCFLGSLAPATVGILYGQHFVDSWEWCPWCGESLRPLTPEERQEAQATLDLLALDETGAIRPREGVLKRVLRRLWPVGGRYK